MLKIGNLVLQHGLCQAPLAGVSDHTFRKIVKDFGAEYTVSEMVSAKALCYEQKCKRPATEARIRTAPLAAVRKDEFPMAVQLFGAEKDFMAEAARLLESGEYLGACGEIPPAAIDINMGCPMAKIVGNGEGSALLKTPEKAEEIVRAVVKATKLPVTVKMRSGWDKEHICAVEFAKRMEEAGAAAICIHGRTREQMYAPRADWEIIARVKEAVSVPVIGNGDLFSADDVMKMLRETGCDGVMIARGSLGNPWIFAETVAKSEGKAYTPPTAEERLQTALEHAKKLTEAYGEKVGIPEGKKHLAWYTHGMHGSAQAREKLMQSKTISEIEKIFSELLESENR